MLDLDALHQAELKLRDLAPVGQPAPTPAPVKTSDAPRCCPFLHKEAAA
ncbi:MAG: hypothetical protein AAGF22_02905 [Pseudomonadota bacterium]